MAKKQKKKINKRAHRLEKLALKTTLYIGSSYSIIFHSIFFIGIFALQWFGFSFESIMLILTTAVSLEAIYLAIFIQMTVNHHAHKLAEVSEDVEDISKDIDDIHGDVEEIGKDDKCLDPEHQSQKENIQHIESILKELMQEVRQMKDGKE